jgi:hypothetical protein
LKETKAILTIYMALLFYGFKKPIKTQPNPRIEKGMNGAGVETEGRTRIEEGMELV